MATKQVFNPLSGNFDTIQNVDSFVSGPSSATDNAITRYDGTTGKLVKNSSVTIDDSGNIATLGQITVGSDAVSSLQVVTLQQLQAYSQGVDVKEGVVAASTADLTLSGEQTIDGIALVSGDRVLVKNQTDETQNGIYVVAVGAWTRSTDADTGSELEGALVTVKSGSTQANSGWYQTADTITIGVTNIVFQQFFGAGTYTADGQGIELTGSTFSLELNGSTLSKSASGLQVASGGITNTEINASAAIDYSKLNLSNSIVNADISASAAIAYSKLNLSNSIIDSDISASAAISLSKLATLTSNRAVVSNGSGVVSASTTTDTEIGYVGGVTSAIQPQLDAKLNASVTSQSTSFTASKSVNYLVDSSGGTITVTLPAATGGGWVRIIDAGASETNNISIDPDGAETINGNATYTIESNYQSVLLISTGTEWIIA